MLTGCDLSSTGGTLILNANSSVPPTVQYRFGYGQDELEVVSTIKSEGLDEILSENGVNREQVVSARVDSVLVDPVDPVETTSLSTADIYLGTDDSGPQIAGVTFPSSGKDPVRDTRQTPVTETVKAGTSETFAQLGVEDPSSIPPGGSAVRATVYFQIEAE